MQDGWYVTWPGSPQPTSIRLGHPQPGPRIAPVRDGTGLVPANLSNVPATKVTCAPKEAELPAAKVASDTVNVSASAARLGMCAGSTWETQLNGLSLQPSMSSQAFARA